MRAMNFKCFRFQRAAKATGNEKIITRSSAPARRRAAFLNKSDHTHRNRDWPLCVASFATDNPHFEAVRRPAQSPIKSSHPRDFGLLRSNKRNQRELRDSGRRGEIAQRTHHCFPSDV